MGGEGRGTGTLPEEGNWHSNSPDLPLVCLMVIPVSLGTQASFRRLYDEPIVRGQQPDANSEEKLLGQTRAAEVTKSYQPLFSPYSIIHRDGKRK